MPRTPEETTSVWQDATLLRENDAQAARFARIARRYAGVRHRRRHRRPDHRLSTAARRAHGAGTRCGARTCAPARPAELPPTCPPCWTTTSATRTPVRTGRRATGGIQPRGRHRLHRGHRAGGEHLLRFREAGWTAGRRRTRPASQAREGIGGHAPRGIYRHAGPALGCAPGRFSSMDPRCGFRGRRPSTLAGTCTGWRARSPAAADTWSSTRVRSRRRVAAARM